MRLSKLTLSGFKSFAKTTTLEFPAEVSAIVGPNGSGKSNVAEGVRWALGEQSIKTLRGKRGEDLIFNGSANSPRMGKAAVALTFDNRDHFIPLDFDEIILERKIFRDGLNEYYLNGSQVRLKDIVEILARIGLGETKHNIIGQGEVDRIILASSRERRDMLEEAIGLRLYQLKKREAERKLEETGGNINQIQSLLKEISPHVKFLKSQADKAERRESVRKELEDYYSAYVRKETALIAAEEKIVASSFAPGTSRLANLEKEIALIKKELDNSASEENNAEILKSNEEELAKLETKRRELERLLGRVEGQMETGLREPINPERRVDIAALEAAINPLIKELRETCEIDDPANLKLLLSRAIDRLEKTIRELGGRPNPSQAQASGAAKLKSEEARLGEELKTIDKELDKIRSGITENIRDVRLAQSNLRDRFGRLREREEEVGAIRVNLQRHEFEKEKLKLRNDDLRRLSEESGMAERDIEGRDTPFLVMEPEELKKKIEKFKIRLEEIGGIDSSVLKEYHETKTRYEFLERELADLDQAEKDLKELINELEDRIEHDFKTGFSKIKNEFHNYFRIIFGGGRGVLEYAPIRKTAISREDGKENEAENETDYGIDIDVDLPRKRIKGLAMLSGGERALVSIALLFAITAVNPPPFLILDETDAALDEANSQKYAAILKELSKKTQLVLITHNRETMKQAGVLYGVTMGEEGVSKIISLKLEQAESYANR